MARPGQNMEQENPKIDEVLLLGGNLFSSNKQETYAILALHNITFSISSISKPLSYAMYISVESRKGSLQVRLN